MAQWYFSYGGNSEGPYDQAQAIARAQKDKNGHAWREGYGEWLPISKIAELNQAGGPPLQPPPTNMTTSDQIDFKIMGSEMQFVEIELDPGESAIAEAGAMMYKSQYIRMESVFGNAAPSSGGFMEKLVGAGKRLLTGESLFTTVFTHTGQGKAHVAFAAPFPGNIIPVTLRNIGGTIICQKDSFLCAARGVSIGIFFQRKILTGLFGGEGFIMQKLEGDGLVFMHAGGTIVERQLAANEVIHVDTGCVVGFQPTVQFNIEQAGNIKTALFGGEGLFVASLQGPGKIWLQSLPFSRLAGRMLMATQSQREQGSVLGGFLQGDTNF
ncbi:MAG: TIGR00266 family protein [Bdellovibrionota bacterium]